MGALAADGAVTEEDLSVSELNRVFEPLRSQVSESCDRQDAILSEVQVREGEELCSEYTQDVFCYNCVQKDEI